MSEDYQGSTWAKPDDNPPLAALRYHVTGAIERGEKVAITAITEADDTLDPMWEDDGWAEAAAEWASGMFDE